MRHFTIAHLLYLIAAVDAAVALMWGVPVLNGPEPATDDDRRMRSGRLMLIGGMFAFAILLCLVATFTDVAAIPIS
jgi:hypothetical protein